MTLAEFKYFPELPQYLRFRILTCLSIDDFKKIKFVNREFYELCSGKLTEEIILTYGSQITEHLYKERCSINFSSEICELKDETISWKEFYYCVLNCRKKVICILILHQEIYSKLKFFLLYFHHYILKLPLFKLLYPMER